MTDHTTKSDLVAGITGQMKEMVAIRDSFQADQLKFVKGLINPDLTDTEMYMFLAYAGKAGLNPFNKEIIAVVYSKDNPSKRTVNTITTRDGKRATAYRQGGIESIVTEPIYIKEVTDPTNPEVPEAKQEAEAEPTAERHTPEEGKADAAQPAKEEDFPDLLGGLEKQLNESAPEKTDA